MRIPLSGRAVSAGRVAIKMSHGGHIVGSNARDIQNPLTSSVTSAKKIGYKKRARYHFDSGLFNNYAT
jgi:hypothetical protein